VKRTLARVLPRVVGVGLIFLILWMVGWSDSVTGLDGKEYKGRVLEQSDSEVVLETEEGIRTIAIEGPSSISGGLRSAFAQLRERPWIAAAGLLVHLVGVLLTWVRWGLLLRGAELPTPMRDVMRLSWISIFFACVLPGGQPAGDVIKAVYIARTHRGGKTRAVLTVIVDRVVGLAMLGLLAAVALLIAPATAEFSHARMIILFMVGASAAGAVLVFSRGFRRMIRLDKLVRHVPSGKLVGEVWHAMAMYSGRPAILALTSVLALISHTLLLSAFYLYGLALGVQLPLLAIGLAIPVAQVVSNVPALPGGWGLGDAAFLFFLPATGVAPAIAVTLSFVFRIGYTLISLPGGLMIAKSRRAMAEALGAESSEPADSPDTMEV